MGRAHPGSSLVEAVDLQSLGAELRIYGEINDPAMRHFNPSIAFDGNDLKIAIRSCNFAVERLGKWYFRDGSTYSKTDVIYGDLSLNTLQVSNLEKLELSKDSPTRILVAGLEDVRLFHRKDGMHAIGFESDRLTRSLHNSSTAMAEYLIKGKELKYIRTLEKPNKEVVEKNWQPPDVETPHFEFTYSPSQTWSKGKVSGEQYAGNIHGGTPLIKQEDGTYLSLVHEKIEDRWNKGAYDKFTYYTYLAKHDDKGIVTKLSKPFRFGTLENIEFASGMVEYKGGFIITFGIRDCKWATVKITKSILLGLFE
jgi:hypothetical protein